MDKNLLTIENIRKYLTNGKIDWTLHSLNRLSQRDILKKDVKEAIYNGKIIEYYNDYTHPSCLIFGYASSNKVLHVVCGISNDLIHIITAYYPNSDKWEEDMKTRRITE